MQEQQAVRRLVKSPPELWAQCSDPESLARHLSGFGEIRITRLEPESTIAWEGESVSGTVTLEASGWGTRVALTATPPASAHAPSPPHAQDDPQPRSPILIVTPPALSARGLGARFGTLIKRRREVPVQAAAPVSGQAAPPPTPVSAADGNLMADLEAALDSLGSAHHRPYSRS